VLVVLLAFIISVSYHHRVRVKNNIFGSTLLSVSLLLYFVYYRNVSHCIFLSNRNFSTNIVNLCDWHEFVLT